ncbi:MULTISPECIES: glycogen/starch/alpha-glucan phosphorylase [Hydrocarboniphaga]|jgi:starch phosphorylase|uniref:Alpha-1,4 glucan phosphorylase n=1 Tax=Hydrocarboniphaga effusa AP103 TaxID=1172194 RepID=I7Z8U3_9GAMM|nr:MULTISPECIES: glycogen/starch/alpha-glucan phosphorylase [Hydrocarboniphaga]EIT68082.1 glucan phosphorylase [Hydrocarboniphaga effusa AP103]MDZ4078116.1 glycogen/starch/alpha-glucan phosphorylase [Hydrocarboniphaga sp.]
MTNTDRRVSERASLDKRDLRRSFLDNLLYVQGKFPKLANNADYYLALAHTVRDRLMQRWISTASAYTSQASRTVCYLSAEFLMGPHLGNNLINLGIYDETAKMVAELGLDLEDLLYQEEEPGLGNGGLGRLAACFIDSLATLEVPALGYGIRYEYGIFHQTLVDGWQAEKTDKWLRYGNPWEIARPEWTVEIRFGGHTEQYVDEQQRLRVRWLPARVVLGVPHDTPILGYHVNTANTLRLWKAEAAESFDFGQFNRGDYAGAVTQKIVSENLSKVLYPNDEQEAGKELRLQQQYFFVSASLQDMLRILKIQGVPVENFHEKFAVQLNDTHPAIGVAELMRLLVDEHLLVWDTAWDITCKSFGYTNHTLMPEALERWSLPLFQRVLPRHLEIIYEINARFLDQVRLRFFGDEQRLARMSLIDEHGPRYVRMANLACAGSHAINGVADLHTELLKQDVLKDFYELWPEKFSNKTNGVTPRRWIVLANPRLTALISETLGEGWIKDLGQLRGLERHVENADFRARWAKVKRDNKADLAAHITRRLGISINPDSIFDVQVKRIHEYKRQHLAALHIIALYLRIKANPNIDLTPRTFIFGGKAAPGYFMAKLMIKLITAIGDVVNVDPAVRDRLKVVFMPNFSVTNGQRIYPAADLSEQISTAGKEASGTGNMKFQMNGALTIGTMDGANIEIQQEVGAENFFQFGLSTPEVYALGASGYRPMEYYQRSDALREVIDLIASGFFSRGDASLFKPLVDNLLYHDPYFLLADFDSYVACQDEVASVYRDADRWTRMAILNSARSGKFSSDRTILQYCDEIWGAKSVPIRLLTQEDVESAFEQQ